MTDAVFHPTAFATGAVSRFLRVAALARRALFRAVMGTGTRPALDELPDNLLKDLSLKDLGLARSDIRFAAGALVPANRGDALDRIHRSVAERDTATRLSHAALRLLLAAVVAVSAFAIPSRNVHAQDAQIERGRYLVTLGGCNDCHTPGYFFGKPDMTRFLGGSEVGFEIPALGVFHGPNLTPDRDTGLGQWSTDEIATAITTGRRPDGRVLAPIMPWHAFASLTGQDVRAIAVFLQSLPPVKNKVPGPFGPGEKPTSFVMKIVPPEAATMAGSAPK
jgi:mono/diheme cytochrome c family protein/uncharacterized protein YjiS (DUF1127 family)